jgi:ATP-binding cassette, subfamily F, member 3
VQAVLDCDTERTSLLEEERHLLAEINAAEPSGQGAAPQKTVVANGRVSETDTTGSSMTGSSLAVHARLKEVYDRMQEIDVEGAPARAASILAGLSFDEAMQHRPTKTFSGGAPFE